MSQEAWQQSNQNENTSRSAGRSRDRSQYEGFEGMNYEQRRQPYKPGNVNDAKSKKSSRQDGHVPNNPA